MRDYSATLEATDQLISTFPDHHRYAATLALRGDTYMALGELETAAQAFLEVPDDHPALHDYATFQAGKIYRALQQYDRLRERLHAYVDHPDAHERPRISEALYWIGWSLQQEQRTDEAFPIFEKALTRFGDEPRAQAIDSILSAYSKLRERHQTRDSFATWLQHSIDQSITAGRLTWFARLTRFSAEQQRSHSQHATADATLLSIHRLVPLPDQDPPTLADVGLVLADRGYDSADDYFEELLSQYPKHAARAAAFFGKARLAAQDDQLDDARRWLTRFLEETPTHTLAPDARLLAAEVLARQGAFDAAAHGYNEIPRSSRCEDATTLEPSPASPDSKLSETPPNEPSPTGSAFTHSTKPTPELVAEAYWESAKHFDQLGDSIAARDTLREMLRDTRLTRYESYSLATQALPHSRPRPELKVPSPNRPRPDRTTPSPRPANEPTPRRPLNEPIATSPTHRGTARSARPRRRLPNPHRQPSSPGTNKPDTGGHRGI